ncbi:Gfo/Idh/MocA family oxidoreductase [Geomicrobium sp. JSM 1781026]
MKIGVIGAGNMGENHLRTYASMPRHCELIGVYDVDQSKRDRAAEQYMITSFPSLETLLESVDAVSITVPTPYHFEVGMTCIEYGIHMLMEKPIASTEDEAKELQKAAMKADVTLQVGHIELFNPLIQTLKTILLKEQLLSIETHRMAPFAENTRNVDVVHDLMIHDLYLIHELTGESFDHLHSFGIAETNPSHASVLAKSKQGTIIELTASFRSTKKVRTMQILTDNNHIFADLLQNTITITKTAEPGGATYPKTISENIYIPSFLQPLTLELSDFITNVVNKRTPTVTAQHGIEALKLSNKISNEIKNN